ncbi:hypothetical protein NMG60_11027218 [Bertholletia excelsa]
MYKVIQLFNNIPNPDKIETGHELRIPLPCSCDEVGGEGVVHYGNVVQYGQTVQEIFQKFNTSDQTLLQLNGLASPKDLLVGVFTLMFLLKLARQRSAASRWTILFLYLVAPPPSLLGIVLCAPIMRPQITGHTLEEVRFDP